MSMTLWLEYRRELALAKKRGWEIAHWADKEEGPLCGEFKAFIANRYYSSERWELTKTYLSIWWHAF